MRRRAARGCLAAALLVLPVAIKAQSSDEQARRLLEDGRSYRSQGKLKQALDNFNTIVSGFSSTDSVDDALLEVGRYQLEVDKDLDKARDSFDQVAKRFPQSDGAPGAYYYLGWLTMSRATTAAELEDALAQFTRVQRLYPRSEWVPRALHASGLTQRKAGRIAEAVEAARRVSLEYPGSDAAPAAQFQIGHCLGLLGEYRQAMEEFQQVRNRFSDSEWAVMALDRITALYRLYGSGKPSFGADAAFSVGSGDLLKDVRALLMTPARSLWIASEKTRSAVPFGPDGKMGSGFSAEEIKSLTLSPERDLLLIASKLAVRIGPKDVRSFSVPSDKPGIPDPIDRVAAAVLTPGGSILVADEKRKRVFRYDQKSQYQGPFPDAKDREVVRMLVDDEGALVFLDRDEKSVRAYDESGRLLRTIGPRGTGFELKRPVDVAVDPLRNTYVADEESGVLVFSPQGQFLVAVGGSELKRPKALTLEPSGAVLVYDDRAERVLRFK